MYSRHNNLRIHNFYVFVIFSNYTTNLTWKLLEILQSIQQQKNEANRLRELSNGRTEKQISTSILFVYFLTIII